MKSRTIPYCTQQSVMSYFVVYISLDSWTDPNSKQVSMTESLPIHKSTVIWSCRIHWLHLCTGLKLPQWLSWIWHKTIWWLSFWEMRSTPLLPSLSGPLWPGVVAPDRVQSIGQIELNCVLMLNWIVWNRTVFCIKMNLALNILQRLICHKTKPNPIHYKSIIWSSSDVHSKGKKKMATCFSWKKRCQNGRKLLLIYQSDQMIITRCTKNRVIPNYVQEFLNYSPYQRKTSNPLSPAILANIFWRLENK